MSPLPSHKGVELSLNTVILIVMGLVVAAIVIFLVTKNAGGANNDLGACEAKGGHCWSGTSCLAGESGSTFFTKGCGPGEICCMPEKTLLGEEE